jgi:hypothetical protein
MLLQIIPREHNFDFLTGRKKIDGQCESPDQPGASTFYRRNNFSFEHMNAERRNSEK